MHDQEYSILAGNLLLIQKLLVRDGVYLYSLDSFDQIYLSPFKCPIFLGSFAAMFGVIGFIMNILVVLALRQVAQSDLPTLFVISLSFSDLVMCGFTLPLQSARFLFR